MTASSYSDTSLKIKKAGYLLGPAIFLFTLLTAPPDGMAVSAWNVCGLAAWMAIWWMTEAIPLAATALLPVLVYPLCNIVSLKDTLTPYANPIIFLFLGGFLIATAIQKTNLHLRIALTIVRFIGTKPDKVVAGFMVSSAFLSMWISNTATMLMMLPIALSVVALMRSQMEKDASCPPKEFGICMLLGIAYASSVGGIGTLIGTPPNAIMSGYMQQSFDLNIGFFEWMEVGVPMVIIMLFAMWWLMTRVLFCIKTDGKAN
ncbi:MAG: SLC13 family permease, partial [Alphaproteobacteria bacterium]